MQELGSATDNPKSIPFLTNAVVVQVSGKTYASTRARTKAFAVEAWRFSGEAKMLALVFFDAIYQRSMITLESSPAYLACSRAS